MPNITHRESNKVWFTGKASEVKPLPPPAEVGRLPPSPPWLHSDFKIPWPSGHLMAPELILGIIVLLCSQRGWGVKMKCILTKCNKIQHSGPWVCANMQFTPWQQIKLFLSEMYHPTSFRPLCYAGLTATICPGGLISTNDSGHSKAT